MGDRWFYSTGYVDSGAGVSVFNMKIAKALGLDRNKGKAIKVTVGDGDQMSVALYRLKIRFSEFIFWAQVGFSEALGTEFNIIGRASFFERFRICFNDHDRLVTTLRLF